MQDHGFLHQALVYLAAGVVMVPLFKRAGLGSVLGYLVAGALIGPWGLALVTDAEAILHVAELGVVLLLFLVGLELNPKRVWQMRRPIFGMGTTQVLATIVVFTVGGWMLGLAPTVALVAGIGIAMSSTAIGLATLQEKNLLPTPGGQASFSVLLFQDLAVIPLMLVLSMLTPGKGQGVDFATVGKGLAAIVLVIVAGRTLLRPVLRYVANTRQREERGVGPVAVAEGLRDREEQHGLEEHDPKGEAEDEEGRMPDQPQVHRHADGDEEEPQQQALEGVDVQL